MLTVYVMKCTRVTICAAQVSVGTQVRCDVRLATSLAYGTSEAVEASRLEHALKANARRASVKDAH